MRPNPTMPEPIQTPPRRATVLNLEAALTPYVAQVTEELKKYIGPPKEPKELYDAVRHLFDAGGKRLRPIMCLLSAQAVGGDATEVLPYAAAIEMVHVYTLIHDDIMDKSDLRRGVPTVHAKYGQSTAILAGDLLAGMAFETLTRLNVGAEVNREIVREFAGLVKEVCEGQQLDLRFEGIRKVDELTYFHMAERKTATIYEIGMKHGAMIAGGDVTLANKLSEAGRLIGLAFQIWDDCLDLIGQTAQTGKPQNLDLFAGKKTLITVFAMEKLDPMDRRILVDLIAKKDKTDADVKAILKLFEKSNAIKLAQEKAKSFTSHAKSALQSLPPTNARTLIGEIAEFATNRVK
jgi:geranylgeranyl diphosphate synthase type I